MYRFFIIVCLMLTGNVLVAQIYTKYTTPVINVNGVALSNPWAGGLNSAIFQTIDLNNDGKKDLFVFEKQSESTYPGVFKIRTFINYGSNGTTDYRYEPFYERFFPQNMTNFCLLRDYDGDGREDLFTYNRSLSAMDVYHNDYNSISGLSFSLQYTGVKTCYQSPGNPCFIAPLFVAPVNQPVLFDVNNDGDLDVLTFQISANFIEYHENQAKELFNRTDTLVFTQSKQAWGHMSLSSNSNSAILGLPRMPMHDDDLLNRHSGTCMIAFDDDGDGDADLINGDLLGDNLLYLHNGATIAGTNDSIDWQDASFPTNGGPVNYVTFPSAYFADANNDGINDLIVSSCTESQAENYNNNWYYHNAGTNTNPDFQFVKNRFLTDEMIDVGTAAMPVFFDVDNDGKQDIIIGNKGYYVTQGGPPHFEGALAYLKNTTTGNCPEFNLVNLDFANIRQYNFKNIYPAFGDLDGDGDADMLLGNEDGTFHYFTNTAGQGNPPQFVLAANGFNFLNLDVGSNSTPQLFDVNNDGLLDIVSGELFGKLSYYQNTGSATSPQFTLITSNFGNINVTNSANTFYGYSTPLLFWNQGTLHLLVGSESGKLFLYNNITGNLNGSFNLVNSNAYTVNEPPRAAPALSDLNGDGWPEIIVGNQAGGLSFYSSSLPGCITAINTLTDEFDVQVYPNPADGYIITEMNHAFKGNNHLTVTDLYGRILFQSQSDKVIYKIPTQHWADGIYLLTIQSGNLSLVKKIMISHAQ